jgi:MoxR-like ATPase
MMEISDIQTLAGKIKSNIAKVIVGKDDVVELVLAALLAGGHVLLDDVPGTGKTMLAKSFARSVGVEFKRVQFTPDLLPSDLTGINYFNQKLGEFMFRSGPIFTGVLLADEINRATPRTQSSLLECMNERQVTVDGTTYKLAEPYFVIATQNPVESQGTFPLPEAQLDRFIIKTSVGYPKSGEAAAILRRFINDSPFDALLPVCTGGEAASACQSVKFVYLSDELIKYIVAIVEATRTYEGVAIGVSPRGSLAMMRCAQALAAINGRGFVTPEDIKRLAPCVFGHRLMLHDAFGSDRLRPDTVIGDILASTPVPTESWER